MKTNIFKHLAATALGLLGFASCEKIGIGLTMYGEPHADFKAIGTVKAEDGKPIEGIRVAVRRHSYIINSYDENHTSKDWPEDDTVYTDSKGVYEMSKTVFGAPDAVTVVFEDVDGSENGGYFGSRTAEPQVKQTKKGDKNWYSGAFEAQADAVMPRAVPDQD